MNYVALDLGTKCGMAFTHNGEIKHQLLNFTDKGRFSKYAFYDFYQNLDGILSSIHDITKPAKMFIEKPFSGSFFHATRILFGLMGVAELVCQERGMKYQYYSPTTIKKYWCGTGRASKAQMVARTQETYPGVRDHNVSDSLALLHYGMSQEIG